MATKKVMKLIDKHTGLMQCRICGAEHLANYKSGGKFKYGSWQCVNKCKFDDSYSIKK